MNNTDIIQTIALVLLTLYVGWLHWNTLGLFETLLAWMDSIGRVIDESNKEHTARLGDLERRVGAKWDWDGEEEDPAYGFYALGRELEEDDDEGLVN